MGAQYRWPNLILGLPPRAGAGKLVLILVDCFFNDLRSPLWPRRLADEVSGRSRHAGSKDDSRY